MVNPAVKQLRILPCQPAAVYALSIRIQQSVFVKERHIIDTLFPAIGGQRHRLITYPIQILQGYSPIVPICCMQKSNTAVIQRNQFQDNTF